MNGFQIKMAKDPLEVLEQNLKATENIKFIIFFSPEFFSGLVDLIFF